MIFSGLPAWQWNRYTYNMFHDGRNDPWKTMKKKPSQIGGKSVWGAYFQGRSVYDRESDINEIQL